MKIPSGVATAPVILVRGSDSVLVRDAVVAVDRVLVGDAEREFCVEDLSFEDLLTDAEEVVLGRVVAAAHTPAFLADRRVVVNSQALADMLQGKLPIGMGLAVEDVEELRKSMHEVITAWWADEPEDLREDLRDALQISRGIPQEVDRQLLLRMRQRLARALSLPEKKMLRETLRTVVSEPSVVGAPVPAGDGFPPDSDE